MRFTTTEINTANKTSRSRGIVGSKAIVPAYVLNNVYKSWSILDFGAGKDAMHTKMLRNAGFSDVTAHDFGNNLNSNHDANALNRKYSVVFASNVLNTQSSTMMLLNTLEQIKFAVGYYGTVIMNYPESPRYLDMDSTRMLDFIERVLGKKGTVVGGTKRAPLWKFA